MANQRRVKSKSAVKVFAAVTGCAFTVLIDPTVDYARAVELNLALSPRQVDLYFRDGADMTVGKIAPDYLQIYLPLTALPDILLLLRDWNQKNLEIDYDSGSNTVSRFGLTSLNQ